MIFIGLGYTLKASSENTPSVIKALLTLGNQRFQSTKNKQKPLGPFSECTARIVARIWTRFRLNARKISPRVHQPFTVQESHSYALLWLTRSKIFVIIFVIFEQKWEKCPLWYFFVQWSEITKIFPTPLYNGLPCAHCFPSIHQYTLS